LLVEGAQRPVMVPKGGHEAAVAPVPADGQVRQPEHAQCLAQLPQRLQRGVGVGHVRERVVVQLQLALAHLQPRPGDAPAGQPAGEALGAEVRPLVHAEVGIDDADHLQLQGLPMFVQQSQRGHVHGDAVVLDVRDGLHEPASQDRPGEVDVRQQLGQQPRQGSHVRPAIVEQRLAFLVAVRAAADG
jgi:hypothetical protein